MRPRLSSRAWRGPYTWPGVAAIALVTAAAWAGRFKLAAWQTASPHGLVAILIGTIGWLMAGYALLTYERSLVSRAWRRRLIGRAGLDASALDPITSGWRAKLGDPLEWLARPILRTDWGRGRRTEWEQAGLGRQASRYLLLLAAMGLAGGLTGYALAGPVLAVGLGAVLPLAPAGWVRRRARQADHRFEEQLPEALDAIAAGLSAGLALEGAIRYAAAELPSPVAVNLGRVARRLSLGIPADVVLDRLLEEQPRDSLALAVEGIQLQRRLGGDLISLLKEVADLIRQRLELAREVQAVSAQGRLSGGVIAGLVPVSAGILLLFNPRYIDVLFDTLIGQVLLVISLLLLLVGWAVMSMLIRRAV